MSTNPTPEHKEQARRLAESVHIGAGCSCAVNSPTYICLAHEAIEHAITAYANQRNTEVREVLEGLATRVPDGLCWCPDTGALFDGEAIHGIDCQRTQTLYAKLQRGEESLTG